MDVAGDSYKTLAGPAEAVFRERGSRFIAYAWPVGDEAVAREHLEALRKKYYDATHCCYAWRLGVDGTEGTNVLERTGDDGEPSGTAGKPILGQILSLGLTNVAVIVVRWFGGTKLGVPGLINAYREAARAALEAAETVERTVDVRLVVRFGWASMNDVMRVVKEMSPTVVRQEFDNVCGMELTVRCGLLDELAGRLGKCEGVEVKMING